MSKPSPARYRTTNWSSYTASLRKRGSLLIWLDKEMTWLAPPDGSPGRPAMFSDAAIQFCLSIKVLFKLPLRQTAGLVTSLLRLADLDWPVPDYTTMYRRQSEMGPWPQWGRASPIEPWLFRSPIAAPMGRSTCLSTMRHRPPSVRGRCRMGSNSSVAGNGRPASMVFRDDGEPCRAIGPSDNGERRKVHLAMDTATSDIRAVEFTPSRDGDSPVLPDLLEQIPEGEDIGTVTADGAYDTRRCHAAILQRDAVRFGHSFRPMAVMPSLPIRKNGLLWKEDTPAAIARNETLRATRYYGRAFWKRWTGYHARSRIEAKMRCLKSFGERIAARDPDRQTAEIHIRIALINRFNALGTAEVVRVS